MARKALFTSFIFTLFFCSSALAQKTNIIFDADFMEKNNKKGTITLRKNVNVIFHQQHLLADEAIIYQNRSTVIAKGNISLQTAKTTLRGEKIEFNYDTNKGKLYKGVITSGQVLIESDLIEKIGEEEYVADNAYYTACLTCPPSWGFTSTKITAEIGGYAYINRPWLYLLQVPVLPLPYLAVPLNSKRQTGFLVPKPSTSGLGGFTFEQPFFWAIDKSHDATFSLIQYEKRGTQILGNYRYVIAENSSGELNTSYMKDRTVGQKPRWFTQYKHYYKLPNNYIQRADIALASDRLYPRHFPDQFAFNGQAALDNSMSITKNSTDSHLSLDTSYYISLIEDNLSRLETNPNSLAELNKDNKRSLHRLPEINYSLMDQKVSDDYNIFFNFEAQYLNISRNDIAFDRVATGINQCATTTDENGDPSFGSVDDDPSTCIVQPHNTGSFAYGPEGIDPLADPDTQTYGDLVRTGQRLDMIGTFHSPFWIGKTFDVDPSVSLRHTQYSLGVQTDKSSGYDSFPSRSYAQYDLSTKTYLSKIYKWGDKGAKLKHSIIPEINLRYIPEVHQTKNHFFGDTENTTYSREKQPIDDSDLDWRNGGRGIQFDQRDRIIGRQFVNFALTNKLISRGINSLTNGAFNKYDQNLLFRVSQAFDLREDRRGGDGWQDLQALLLFRSNIFTQSLSANHFPYHGKTRWVSRSRYYFDGSDYVGLDYTKSYIIETNPPVDESTRTEIGSINTGMNFKYLYLFGQLEYDIKLSEFKQWRVAAQIKPPGSCWIVSGGVSQPLDQPNIEPIIDFSMEFQFGQ